MLHRNTISSILKRICLFKLKERGFLCTGISCNIDLRLHSFPSSVPDSAIWWVKSTAAFTFCIQQKTQGRESQVKGFNIASSSLCNWLFPWRWPSLFRELSPLRVPSPQSKLSLHILSFWVLVNTWPLAHPLQIRHSRCNNFTRSQAQHSSLLYAFILLIL